MQQNSIEYLTEITDKVFLEAKMSWREKGVCEFRISHKKCPA
jgi:hypothetical protein